MCKELLFTLLDDLQRQHTVIALHLNIWNSSASKTVKSNFISLIHSKNNFCVS